MAWQERALALRASVPDPGDPVLLSAPVLAGKATRWNAQRARRARILGSARSLIIEAGLDNVQITQVADRSNVSVQTVYNVVGSRRDMLVAAASEWIVALAETADALAQERDLNVIFTIIELFWVGAITCRGYGENLIRAQAQRSMLERPFVDITARLIEKRLGELACRNALVSWVDHPAVAYNLAVGSHGCVRSWLENPYDEGRFRKQLVMSCGLLLRGAMQGAEIQQLEKALDLG